MNEWMNECECVASCDEDASKTIMAGELDVKYYRDFTDMIELDESVPK